MSMPWGNVCGMANVTIQLLVPEKHVAHFYGAAAAALQGHVFLLTGGEGDDPDRVVAQFINKDLDEASKTTPDESEAKATEPEVVQPDAVIDPQPDKDKPKGYEPKALSPESDKWSGCTKVADVVRVIMNDEGTKDADAVLVRFKEVKAGNFCQAASVVSDDRVDSRVKRAYEIVKEEIPF